jgi:replication factor A1
VDHLTPGSAGHNLVVKVVSLKPIVEKTKVDGSKVKVAEVLVGDNTGAVVLLARNGEIFRVEN